MSPMKWALAMAGTAMTVRYLSRRNRQSHSRGSLAPQRDRDDSFGDAGDSTLPGTGADTTDRDTFGSQGMRAGSSSDSNPYTVSAGGSLRDSSPERF